MKYIYSFSHVQGTTGYADFVPEPAPDLENGLKLLSERPNDIFLKRYLLRVLVERLNARDFSFADSSITYSDLNLLFSDRENVHEELKKLLEAAGCAQTCIIKSACSSEVNPAYVIAQKEIRQLFWENIHCHQPLDLENPVIAREESEYLCKTLANQFHTSQEILQNGKSLAYVSENLPEPDAKEVYQTAFELLTKAGILAGGEMRHESSLSPIALLRNWNLTASVGFGRNRHTVSGIATAWGRGLSLARARVSCIMEVVERASACGHFATDGTCGSIGDYELVQASWLEFQERGLAALDPCAMGADEFARRLKLNWVKGVDASGSPIYAPAQAIYLFSNLDEDVAFEQPDSTGLAAGSSPQMAKTAALQEIIERYAHATTPFIKNSCFELTSRDPVIRELLEDYRWRGIRVQFQDITTEFGVPAYRCFVSANDGRTIAQATGADLCGPKAALSALTETPWPYAWANPRPAPSGPGLTGLPVLVLEDLPDYSLNNVAGNLALLETVFTRAGYMPCYINLARPDLKFPVYRAFVPGLPLDADLCKGISGRLLTIAGKERG